MRFDSYFALVKFVMGLRYLGYLTPFIDYKEDMNNNGLNKHIHTYKAELNVEDKEIHIIFKDATNNEVYKIVMKKKSA